MNNPMVLFLGNTFPVPANIGNFIESSLGAKISPMHKADLGFWEIKSRANDAKAYITLGGKKDGNINDLLTQVYEKIENVLFFEYDINPDKTFTITRVTLLWGLSKEVFWASFGKAVKMEKRSDGQKTLKVSRKSFVKLYGKKVIEYSMTY